MKSTFKFTMARDARGTANYLTFHCSKVTITGNTVIVTHKKPLSYAMVKFLIGTYCPFYTSVNK